MTDRQVLWARLPLLLLALLAALPAGAQQRGKPAVMAIVGGMLVDGAGGPVLHDAVVVIRGERLVAGGSKGTVPIPPGAKIINAGGMTVMPGLWDLHVHLMIMGHGKYREYFPRYRNRMRDISNLQNVVHVIKGGTIYK